MPVTLVTGASSGIGHAAAHRLAAMGHETYAAARRTSRVPDGTVPLALDLAQPDDVDRAVQDVLDPTRVDVLVHAAATGDFGPVETSPLPAVRDQLEVGLVGAARLVQLVLPGMRERGHGRIVLVSSIAADFSSPMAGWYHAGKAALESVADALRVEVAPFGVDVSLVRPGPVRTAFHDQALARLAERTEGTAYAAAGRAVADYHRRSLTSSMVGRPGPVVDAVVHAATAARPRSRYLVGRGARVATALPRVVPDRVWDVMTRRQMGL